MKKLILVLSALFFVSAPLTALAESPLSLPTDAKAQAKHYNQKGISHYEQGNFDDALKYFETAERFQRVKGSGEASGEVYFNEALAYHAKATRHFKEAERLTNGNSKILNSEVLKFHLKKR